jgi:hypothetical protein
MAQAGALDGRYEGTRVVKVAKKDVCRPTSIEGEVKSGRVSLTLLYNGAVLTGTVGAGGVVSLRGASRSYGYEFDGRFRSRTLSGVWRSVPDDCAGTWTVSQRSR